MISTSYDPEADAFSARFGPKGAYAESQEVAPGVILDFDAKGQVIGIEVLNVSRRGAEDPGAASARRAAE